MIIIIFSLIAVLCASYVAYALLRPLPAPTVRITPPVMPALVRVDVPWPNAAAAEQSAFGALGYGLLDQSGPQKPLPMASVNKVITALAVLQKKPLKAGESGPTITLTQQDVDLYNAYVAKDGSVVPVYAGETINQYQALQALMLPSANNIADTLVDWAFGDMDSYLKYANQYVDQLGMKDTTVADASGFAPASASTATDLIKLGETALAHPVLSTIVGQKTAEFPEVGTIRNVNNLLGQSGIRGIKTGNTDEAGGVFLGAADITVAGKPVTVVTAVMGAPDLGAALRASLVLAQAAPSEFQSVQVVRSGQVVGTVTTAWGAASDIIADKPISVVAWTGTTVAPKSTAAGVTVPAAAGTKAGALDLSFNGNTQTSDLTLSKAIGEPEALWRLRNPF